MTASSVVSLRPDRSAVSPADQLAGAVSTDLVTSERHLDQFLASLGRGLATMTGDRADAGLRAAFAQRSLERYGAVITQGIAMRSAIVEAHQSFAREARREAIDWTRMGPTESTPMDPEKDGPQPGG